MTDSNPKNVSQIIALAIVALMVGCIAYVVIDVRNMPPLKYGYILVLADSSMRGFGPYDSLTDCLASQADTIRVSEQYFPGAYRVTACAPMNPPAAGNQ